MSIADLVYCPDGVNHAFLIEEVQAERKRKYKSYLCPRCKEELVKLSDSSVNATILVCQEKELSDGNVVSTQGLRKKNVSGVK